MKYYRIIMSTALALFALASCTKKMEYNSVPFVSFDKKNISVNESAGTVSVNVNAYNITNESTVTLSFDGNAKLGENYTVSGAEGGIIKFTESGTKEIVFTIIDHPGEYLGNLNIAMTLESTSIEVGALNKVNITIVENDIPVNWDFVQGNWKAQDYDADQADGDEYDVTITKIDDETLALSNLWGGGSVLTGKISFDSQTNTASIAFDSRQVVMDATAYGYGQLWLIGLNDAGQWALSPVIATVSAAGITIGPWNMLITAGQYAGYTYGESYTTVLTK